jgi:hypothetical protein
MYCNLVHSVFYGMKFFICSSYSQKIIISMCPTARKNPKQIISSPSQLLSPVCTTTTVLISNHFEGPRSSCLCKKADYAGGGSPAGGIGTAAATQLSPSPPIRAQPPALPASAQATNQRAYFVNSVFDSFICDQLSS